MSKRFLEVMFCLCVCVCVQCLYASKAFFMCLFVAAIKMITKDRYTLEAYMDIGALQS